MTANTEPMTLLTGINHVAVISADLDRLMDFYRRMFGAETVLDMKEEHLRIALIEVGPTSMIAAFVFPDGRVPEPGPKFARGRHDHVCLNAASEAAFRELRGRLVAEGATDGTVIDVGPAMEFSFTDPDGWEGEVMWVKPGVTWSEHKRPADWVVLDMDGAG